MATIPPGTQVTLDARYVGSLRYPPPAGADLYVAVHADALKAPHNRLTQVVATANGALVWTAALDEQLLHVGVGATAQSSARAMIAAALLTGSYAWGIIRPGGLTTIASGGPLFTVYHGARPWVAVGALSATDLLCMPLNDAQLNPKWYAPVIKQSDMEFPGNSKNSQLELAHLWSLPLPAKGIIGRVHATVHASLGQNVTSYFA